MHYSTQKIQFYDLFFKDYPDVLTTKDLQNILGISGKTVFRLLHSDQIKSIKVGRSFRMASADAMVNGLSNALSVLSKEKAHKRTPSCEL